MSENNSSESTNHPLFDALWEPLFAFEDQKLGTAEIQQWFALLVKTGYIWKLPTDYVLHAASMIDHGYVGSPKREMDS